MLAASIVIKSESGAPITILILLEGGLYCLGAATTLEDNRSKKQIINQHFNLSFHFLTTVLAVLCQLYHSEISSLVGVYYYYLVCFNQHFRI